MANNLKKLVMGEGENKSEFLITPDWDNIDKKPPIESLADGSGIKVTGAIEFERTKGDSYRIPRIFTGEEMPTDFTNYQIGDIFILIEKTAAASSEEGET